MPPVECPGMTGGVHTLRRLLPRSWRAELWAGQGPLARHNSGSSSSSSGAGAGAPAAVAVAAAAPRTTAAASACRRGASHGPAAKPLAPSSPAFSSGPTQNSVWRICQSPQHLAARPHAPAPSAPAPTRRSVAALASPTPSTPASASAASTTPTPAIPTPPPAPAAPLPAASPPALASTPQLPLCRRPAAHVEPLAAVARWRQAQAERIAALGDTWEQRDGGPGAELLLRELDWVLDDVIEAVRYGPPTTTTTTTTAAAAGPTSPSLSPSSTSTGSSTSGGAVAGGGAAASADAAAARSSFELSGWEETSWRLLEPAVRAAATRRQDTSGWQLRLREPSAVLWEWWERRLTERVPFQYLISSAHWHTYVLAVGPGVLVPRPETEIFPQLVAEALARRPRLAVAPWADLGTGSGAIAIAAADVLRKKNKAAEVWAVDVSPTAAAYAAFNAALVLGSEPGDGSTSSATITTITTNSSSTTTTTNGSSTTTTTNGSSTTTTTSSSSTITNTTTTNSSATSSGTGTSTGQAAPRHVRVVLGSWFAPLRAAGLAGRLGGLLSNPPYIPRREMRGLQEEVGRHEPAGALDGGEGPGLDSLQELCNGAAEMLAPGGLVAFETAGGEQADLVAGLLQRQQQQPGGGSSRDTAGPGSDTPAFVDVCVLEDCYGVRRFVRAYRAD